MQGGMPSPIKTLGLPQYADVNPSKQFITPHKIKRYEISVSTVLKVTQQLLLKMFDI